MLETIRNDSRVGTLTRNQELVYEALISSERPLSAYSILDLLKNEGFRAPLQVYRALDKLVSFGMVHKLESLSAFTVCTGAECDSHRLAAFAICNDCGQVSEFNDLHVEKRLAAWAKSSGFVVDTTNLELRGTCAACTNGPARIHG